MSIKEKGKMPLNILILIFQGMTLGLWFSRTQFERQDQKVILKERATHQRRDKILFIDQEWLTHVLAQQSHSSRDLEISNFFDTLSLEIEAKSPQAKSMGKERRKRTNYKMKHAT